MPTTFVTNPCHLPHSHVHPTTVTAPWGALKREGLATSATAGHHFFTLPSNYPPASPLACLYSRPSSLGKPDDVMAFDQRVAQHGIFHAEKSLYPGLGACCHSNLELKFGIFAPHEEPPDVLCSARCSAPFVAGLSMSHLDYLFYQAVT